MAPDARAAAVELLIERKTIQLEPRALIMHKPIRVRDFMTKAVVFLNPDMDVLTASHLLVQNKISGAPVVDSRGTLVGMLTERDCFRTALTAGYHEELGGLVSDYMSRDVKTVDPEMSVVDLAQLFLEVPYRRFPVMKGNRLIGLISRRDVLRALLTLS